MKVIFTGNQDYLWQTLNETKLTVSSELHSKVAAVKFRKQYSTHFVLLMLHELSKRRLLREHFASCAFHNSFHGGKTRTNSRCNVKILSLKREKNE